MKNLNTRLFWNYKVVNEFEKLPVSPIYKHKNMILLSMLKNFESTLLNIGFGYGFIEKSITEKYPKIALFGFDISDVAVKMIKSKVKGNFVAGNLLNMPFKSKKFDYIFLLDVLEHVVKNKHVLVINSVKKRLNRNGSFVISVPLNENNKDYKNNGHMFRFTFKNLQELLSSSGFKIKKTYFLYAFKKFYYLKTIIAKVTKTHKPNLLIVSAYIK